MQLENRKAEERTFKNKIICKRFTIYESARIWLGRRKNSDSLKRDKLEIKKPQKELNQRLVAEKLVMLAANTLLPCNSK